MPQIFIWKQNIDRVGICRCTIIPKCCIFYIFATWLIWRVQWNRWVNILPKLGYVFADGALCTPYWYIRKVTMLIACLRSITNYLQKIRPIVYQKSFLRTTIVWSINLNEPVDDTRCTRIRNNICYVQCSVLSKNRGRRP